VKTAVALRRSQATDFDAWFELFDAVAREGRWIGYEGPVHRGWAHGRFESCLDSDKAVRFLAEGDGLLLGELFVEVTGGRAELGMMVRDGYRGRGIGSSLMEACLDWCRNAGAHKVILSVWPHNEAGLALYRKYGFEVEGRLKRHYRRQNGELWDAIEMGLILDATSPGGA
jgi:ribosomal protein S18 acetylase RimI-like enzyme